MRLSLRAPLTPARLVSALALAATVSAGGAEACGRDTDCVVGDRTYRIAPPETREGAAPGALIFVHGYRGSAAGVLRNKALVALAERLGVALIAPEASQNDWNIQGAPSDEVDPGADEMAYFRAVADDAAARFGLDRGRMVVAGFSSGGMAVWQLACYEGGAFAGFVPMSGTFWMPLPRDCSGGAVDLIHYHGREDQVVPMAGRKIKDARQGDVGEAMAMMAASGGYADARDYTEEGLDCARRTSPEGRILEICLFTGKHGFRAEYIERAWREIAAARGW